MEPVAREGEPSPVGAGTRPGALRRAPTVVEMEILRYLVRQGLPCTTADIFAGVQSLGLHGLVGEAEDRMQALREDGFVAATGAGWALTTHGHTYMRGIMAVSAGTVLGGSVTVTLTAAEAWLLYDMATARVEAIEAAETASMMDCGMSRWWPVWLKLAQAVGRPPR